MRRMKMETVLGAIAACLLACPQPAQADFYKDVAIGLSELGFNFVGYENFLSGGAKVTVARTFNGETLDFGAAELTLQGTPVLTFTTGGRGMQVVDISFQTRNQNNTANVPFNYTFTTDTGNQMTTITGSLFTDVTASINSFGYYDLDFNISSRQSIEQEGRWSDEEFEQDFDIGPIDLRGNLYADLLAVITDPIFDALGLENIFASFSGAAQFEENLSAAAERARAKAFAGQPLTASEIAELASVSAMGAAWGMEIPDLSFLGDVTIEEDLYADEVLLAPQAEMIPEPASLLLLALSAPALFLRRRVTRRA